jgi:DNA modification methylase
MALMAEPVPGAPGRLPAYQDAGVSVYLGDASEVMAELPAESVDCVITSPPYWGLRDFGVAPTMWGGSAHCSHQWSALQRGRRKDLLSSDLTARAARVGITDQQDAAATNGGRFCQLCGAWLGSLGLEPSPQLFVAHLVDLFGGVRRLLKPTGVLWLNLGDTFYHAGKVRGPIAKQGLKPKDLIGVPWRVALALQADGWFLRSDVIWHKPNPVPEPAIDRPVRAHEFLFLLSKQAHYFYDAEAVREPALIRPSNVASPTLATHGGKYERLRDPMVRGAAGYARRRAPQSRDRNRHSVWTVPTEPFRGSHTATFPTRLVEPCIRAGTSAAGCCSSCGRPFERVLEITYQPLSGRRESRKGPGVFEIEMRQLRVARTTGWRPTCGCGASAAPAVVLDPFAGTGTALAVARRLGRVAVGVELNPAYLELIKRRLLHQNQRRATREEAA